MNYSKEEILKTLDKKVREIINNIIAIVKEELSSKTSLSIYLFGSFSEGKATKYSDIDIALETEKDLTSKELSLIKDRIDDIKTLRKIDFVYLNKTSFDMREMIKREGIRIYEFKKQDRGL